ncbi:MAG TPA: hypothetical protein VGP07_08540, partial [Polyangia bacterium]
LTAHAREAMREDAAPEIRRELALDVPRHPASLGIGVAQFGEQRLRVTGDGRAGRSFVQARLSGTWIDGSRTPTGG